jgi:hypothetical protein
LQKWQRAARRFGLTAQESSMGFELGLSWRNLEKKKSRAEKSGQTLGNYIRWRFRQQARGSGRDAQEGRDRLTGRDEGEGGRAADPSGDGRRDRKGGGPQA